MKKYFFIVLFSLLTAFTTYGQTQIPVCPMQTTFSSMSRGYHFTAPASFTICGLYVPDDASTGLQSVEVVRFTAGAPPAFSATTNSFVSLFYQSYWPTNTMIPCNIQVNAGDIIGVYGCRGTNSTNSYGMAQCVTTILGNNVTLYRSGMQYNLATQQMHDIWSEINYYTGRIFMYINCCPTADFTVTTPICLGDTATVTYTGSGIPPSASFSWSFPGGTPATANTIGPHQVTWPAPGNYTATLQVSQASCTTVDTTLAITVNAIPAADAGQDTAICLGDTMSFTATGGTNYWWSTGDSVATITVSPSTTTTYTVTVEDNGCTASDQVTLTVHPLPQIQVISDTICSGDTGSVFVIGANTYLWDNGTTANPLVDTPAVTTNYTVTAIDVNGCQAVASGEINVIPRPQLSISAQDAHCDKSDGSLSVVATGGSGNYIYTWNTNPPANTADVFDVPHGTYTVTVSNDGCESVATISVANISGPHAAFTINPSQTQVNKQVQFDDQSIGATIWDWDFGDGAAGIGQNQIHSYSLPGTYDVWLYVEDDYGCRDSTSNKVVVTSLFTIYIPNAFSPNGNSTNEIFLPQGVGISEERFIMQIYDRWGNMVFETTDLYEGWDGRIEGQNISESEIMSHIFTYYIKVYENISDISHEYRGTITIVK
jgi:gliding motility-associated-like protein